MMGWVSGDWTLQSMNSIMLDQFDWWISDPCFFSLRIYIVFWKSPYFSWLSLSHEMDQRCKIKECWWMFCSPCAMRSHLYPRRCTTSRSRKWVLPIWTWVWPYDLGIISHYKYIYVQFDIDTYRYESPHATHTSQEWLQSQVFRKPMTVDRPRPHQTQIMIETCPYWKQDLGRWSFWMFSPNLKSFRHVPMWKIYPPIFPANSAIRNAHYEQHPRESSRCSIYSCTPLLVSWECYPSLNGLPPHKN